jgi:hypothetical protein
VGPASGRIHARLPLLVAVLLAFLVLGPVLLSRGYALTYDMVFVPHLPWSGSLLGLDGAPPRAVPSDAVVSLASHLVVGDLVQKAVLLATLVAAGAGAARLVTGSVSGQLGACVAYAWNPFVYERLVLGHWTLLVGYAALPWAVAGAASPDLGRAGRRTGLDWRLLGPALAATAAAGPYAALIVLPTTALVALLRRGAWSRRLVSTGTVALVGFVVAAPWWLPAVLSSDAVRVDPGSIDAFAPRADTALGGVGSLLSLGGTWNAQVAPPGRGSVAVALVTVAFLVVAGLGLVARWTLLPDWRRGLAVAAAGGLLVASATTLPAGRSSLRWLVDAAPALGLLRDSQKLVAPWALLCAVGFGCGVSWLRRRLAGAAAGVAARSVPLLVLAVPLVLVPALLWGAGGRLEPVPYPPGWQASADQLEKVRAGGAVLVLPWGTYRRYPWNGGRTVLDPASRYFGGPAYSSAELPVGGHVLVDRGGPTAPVVDARDDAARVVAAAGLGATALLTESTDGRQVAVAPLQPTGDVPAPVPVSPVVTVDVLVAIVVLLMLAVSAGPARVRLLL